MQISHKLLKGLWLDVPMACLFLFLQTGAMIRTPRLLTESETPGARKTTEEICFSAFAQGMAEENGNVKDIYLNRVQVRLDVIMKLECMTFMLQQMSTLSPPCPICAGMWV